MNIVFIILSVVGAVIVLVLLIAALMKKQYALSSSIVIMQPKEKVFDYVRHLRNQENYSKWVMADPNVKLTYTGTDGTVGFKAAWNSEDKNVGVGEQEITRIKEGERYDVELRFEKPFKGTNYAHTTVEAVSPDRSKVTTVFEAKTPFPMNIIVPMLSKMLQKDMDQNAAKLKQVLETQS
ncbi:MAG: hypothetical protein K0S33_588 [Bacteroidetes bacterium]|jgi:hypothetical protein|nr:hypothetical protein [Bacteroidota bacterium]